MNFAFVPNIITIARIILVAPLVWALMTGQFGLALVLFAIAGISDGIDGFLARHFKWESWLGSVLDPLADKLLQASSYITLGALGYMPWWIVAAVVGRDIILVTGGSLFYMKFKHFDADPSLLSKFNTFVQIVYVLLVIVSIDMFKVPYLFVSLLGSLVLLTTITSGIHYVSRWVMLARQQAKQ